MSGEGLNLDLLDRRTEGEADFVRLDCVGVEALVYEVGGVGTVALEVVIDGLDVTDPVAVQVRDALVAKGRCGGLVSMP